MDTGRVNGGGAGRRSINLGVVDRLFDYAVADPLVVRCRVMLTQVALLQNKFTVRIGASTSELDLPYLNGTEFLRALVRTWVEVNVYLRLIGIAVLRVPKDRTAWLQRFAENVEAGAVPWEVVRLKSDTGHLYEQPRPPARQQFVYEPKDEKERGAYFYHIYRDADAAFIEAILPGQLMSTVLDPVTARIILSASSARSAGGFGPAGQVYLLRSPFFSLLRHAIQLYEIEENILDAEHQATHPISVFTKRPFREIAPSLIGAEALEIAPSSRAAAQMETQMIMHEGFRYGVRWMEENVLPQRNYSDPLSGESSTKAGVMRGLYDRSNPNDDALLMPEDIATVTRGQPVFKVDIDLWRANHLREVAMEFQLPISYVEASFIGQAAGSAATKSTSSRLSSAENTGIDEQADRTFRAERGAFGRFFEWLYPRTLGGFELVELNRWIELITADQQMQLGRLLARTSTTKSERRAQLAALLVQGSRRKGRKRVVEEEEDTSTVNTDTGMTAADLRALIAERLQAKEYLPAVLHFDADDALSEDLLRPEDMLPDNVIKLRLETARVLIEGANGGAFSGESVRRTIEELLGVKLDAPSKEELQRHIPLPVPKAPPGKK